MKIIMQALNTATLALNHEKMKKYPQRIIKLKKISLRID